MVVAVRKPSLQCPAPSQESVPSQAPPFEVPVQLVVSGLKPSAGQAPDEPVQLSATSHSPAAARQMVVAVRKPSLQCPAPSQESVPSQAPPFEVPVQLVVSGLKPSAGQAPDEPVQLSATSHSPAAARQVVVDDRKPSLQCPAPSQESVPSQAPPFEVPVQLVVDGAKPSAGQSADVPVQLSATSQGFPFVPRQMVVAGRNDPSGFVQGPSFLSVNVQVTVSPLCKTMLPGVCVWPWSLEQVELVSAQLLGTLSATEYVPSDRGPLLNSGSASLRLKVVVAPPGLVNVKLKLVGSAAGLVTLSTLITPGTKIVIPGRTWQLHLEGAPTTVCSGLVHKPLPPACSQLKQTLGSTLPSPLVSIQATWMLWMLEYIGLFVLVMSPHLSMAFDPEHCASVVQARARFSEHLFWFGPVAMQKLSRSVHGGVGLTGKSVTEHRPVRAFPPSCAAQTPIS